MEPFYPVGWDSGTHLVLGMFYSYLECLGQLRPYTLYLLQFSEKNRDLIPMPVIKRLALIVNQIDAARKIKVGTLKNLVTRVGHRTTREFFAQICSIRIEFDTLATKRVVEVVEERDRTRQQGSRGALAVSVDFEEEEPEAVITEDPSNWAELQDPRIIDIKRNCPDEVQAALIWIRDALAIFTDAFYAEQAQSLLELHTEWLESISKPVSWYQKYFIPSERRRARNLRDRVMQLKWSIAGHQDQFVHLEKERRAEYLRRQQEMAEATSELARREPASPDQRGFGEIGAWADDSEAFQDPSPSSPM